MLTIVLDGITFQHAAELLFDWGETRQERTTCCHTYTRCLEDIAFAVLFADSVLVPNRMPNVGAEKSPGTILKDTLPASIVMGIEDASSPSEKERIIRDDLTVRDAIIADLTTLASAVARRPDMWHECVRREHTYLGTDESLRRSTLSASEFKYRATHYVPRSVGLHEYVQDQPLMELAKELRQKAGPDVACDEAVNEFLRSFLVTHIANYWTFDKACTPLAKSNGVRLPHVTRSIVREINGTWESRLTRQLVPHALADVLRSVSRRDEIIDRLLVLRETKLYRQLRRYMLDALVELDAYDDSSGIRTIIDDIERLTRSRDGEVDAMHVKDVKVGMPVLSLTVSAEKLFMPRRFYLRFLVAAGSFLQYHGHLLRVFPELRAG